MKERMRAEHPLIDSDHEHIDESRRAVLGLGAAGAGALLFAGCLAEGEEAGEIGEVSAGLKHGVDAKVAYGGVRGLLPTNPPATDEHVVVFARGRDAAGDGGEAFFWWHESETADDDNLTILKPTGYAGVGRWKRMGTGAFSGADLPRVTINVNDFGARGNGDISSPDTTEIRNAFNHADDYGVPVIVRFSPGYHYVIDGVINCDLPTGSIIDARGARIEARHNGIAFDLNPAATAAGSSNDGSLSKVDITWLGGQLINTNANKSGSIAIQTYLLTGFTAVGVLIGNPAGDGFKAGFKFAGRDTYHFVDCHVRASKYGWWVPPPDVVFNAANSALDLQDVELRGCHSTHGTITEAGFFSENRVNNLHLNGGSFNGESLTAHVLLSDNTVNESRGFCSSGVHYEQIAGNKPAVQFNSVSGGKGFIGVSFVNGNRFSSGTAQNVGWRGVRLDNCLDVEFGSNHFIDGTGGGTEEGIFVDGDSRRVRISEQTTFLNYAPGKAIVLESAATCRRNVTLEPEICAAGGRDATNNPDDTPQVLSGWNFAVMGGPGTGSNVLIDMSVALASFGDFLLPPRGYFVTLCVYDPDSAAAVANTCWASIRPRPTDDDFGGIRVECQGRANNSRVAGSGYVSADENGDIYFSCVPRIAGTASLAVKILVTAVRQ